MIQLGDITKISGYTIPPVDVITFGSPCQNLSIAGKREGLSGKQSGLFREAIRIIREMREETNGRYPAYAVWENVPGAFSSKKGEDFKAVLEEISAVCGNTDAIPRPPKKWLKAGCIMGNGWSIAWRVLDAQYWGVPQRRKRIFLVVDFGGCHAAEILFKCESLSRNFEKSEKTWESLTTRTGNGADEPNMPAGAAGFTGGVSAKAGSIGYSDELCPTLRAGQRMHVFCIAGNVIGRSVRRLTPLECERLQGYQEDVSYTLNTIDRHAVCSPHQDAIYDCRGNGNGSIACALIGDHQSCVTDYTNIILTSCFTQQRIDEYIQSDVASTQTVHQCKEAMDLIIGTAYSGTYQQVGGTLSAGAHPGGFNGQGAYNDMLVAGIDCRNGCENGNLCGTLQAKSTGGYSLNYIHPVRIGRSVRRLTPLECERLQGYPDGWTNIPGASDSKRYKALGNSVAVPCVLRVLGGISDYLPHGATLGSLFDGIGGFPLAWEIIHGKGTAIWASEIEPFPMAVTAARF